MKTRPSPAAGRAALVLAAWVCAAVALEAASTNEVPNGSIVNYRFTPLGRQIESIMTASNWTRVTEREVAATFFERRMFRNGDLNQLQLIVQAPVCQYDNASKDAWNQGHIVLFTPTTNVFTQGDGFLFSDATHVLEISNNVETRVVKSLLKSPLLGSAPSNGAPAGGQILKILSASGRFNYPSNRVDYERRVRVIDPQYDLNSGRLAVQFTTNGALETALARDDVVITTTNKGRATGARAFYYLTNNSEMMELTGDAAWQNGAEQAQADYFLYDTTRHFLTGSNHVHVLWPNAPSQTNRPPQADTNGFREMFARFATLQWPPTNGPVESMTASGDVMITNQADHSRATGQQAVYNRTNDSFELTGDPAWWNGQMEVKGRVLLAELTNKIYHARGDAQLRVNVSGAGKTNAASASGGATNQWLIITSAVLDYETNLATFHDHVVARLIEDGALRDTLTCDLLVVTLESNQVVQGVARGHVRGQTAPNRAGVVKTISCATLTGRRSPATGLMKDLLAETDVVLVQFGTGTNSATNQLTAPLVRARFSPVTNRIEQAEGEGGVVIDQRKAAQTLHATGERAVYTEAAGLMRLTGTPRARTESYIISNASFLNWRPKTNLFEAGGRYIIIPIRAKTNQPSR